MATLVGTAAAATVAAKYSINGDITRVVSFTCNPTVISAGDVIQMLKVPAGASIINLRLYTDQFTGGTGTIGSVGDGNAVGRYLGSASTSTSLAAALVMLPSAIGYTYTAEDTIDVVYGTVTSASLVGVITLAVTYTNDV